MLLPTSELKRRLVEHFASSTRCWVYSAFVTQVGVNFLLESRTVHSEDRLLVRCQLRDVVSGACSLNALGHALRAGIQVRLSSALHVKLYFFDSALFVGSANLTGKGLALVGYCNDELSTEGVPTDRDNEIAGNLWNQGVELNLGRIEQMLAFVAGLETSENTLPSKWPEGILSENRDLYCSDFPQGTPNDADRWMSLSDLKASMAFQWLLKSTRGNGGSASFGYLSQKLHNDVYDDPTPYRRAVKDLLANLLQLVETFRVQELQVTTPNRSQVVTLH